MDKQIPQEKGIDGIDFKKEIKKEIEDLFIKRYKKLGGKISGLTESFSIDLKTLNDLLSNNKSKPFCKFYYIQKDSSLNLALSFSDNQECEIKSSDALYTLEGELLKEKDLIDMINSFKKGIGSKLVSQTGMEDILISYSLVEINDFIKKMKESHPTIFALKFNMLQYRSTNLNGEILADFEKRNDRISFCVHALFNKDINPAEESAGYDLGNLRP